MIKCSLRFLDFVFISFKESWVALSFIRLWNHSSYGSALSASGIKWPFFFSGESWHKATEGNTLWAREERRCETRYECVDPDDCGDGELKAQWAGRKRAAFHCKALVKHWKFPDVRSPTMTWLPEITSVQLWYPVPVSIPPLANPGSAQSLVFWRLDDIAPGWYNSMYVPFLACSGDRPGMEESLIEMCEPESARVTVPKCSYSGLCFYSQSWRVSDGGLSWKCALTWIHSVFTWGCHAGFVCGGESRAMYLPISCSRNLVWH